MISCSVNNAYFCGRQCYGIQILAGVSDRFVIKDCRLLGNQLGTVNKGATGTSCKTSGNIGHETPLGAPS